MIYEYKCLNEDCGHSFEMVFSVAEITESHAQYPVCPACDRIKTARVFTVPNLVIGGWRSRLSEAGKQGAIDQADMGVFDMIGHDPETNEKLVEIDYEPHQ